MKQKEISIEGLKKNEVTFSIKGTSLLCVNNFSKKSKQQILDKHMKKARVGREAKDPHANYLGSLYLFEDGERTGFPANGFKKGMVRAGKLLGYNMTDIKGVFYVTPDEGDLIELHGDHSMREDVVRNATGVPDIRHRAQYPEWTADLNIVYNANSISAEELAKLLEVAGFSCGIGEWRPEKSNSGSWGLYELDMN